MSKKEYICRNTLCEFHKGNYLAQEPGNCFVCKQPLVEKFVSQLFSTEEKEIISDYPYVIAYQYFQLIRIDNGDSLHSKIIRLKDVFEFSLRYIALLVISEYFNSDIKSQKINDSFNKNLLKNSTIGNLEDFIREVIPELKQLKHKFFIPELIDFYELSINSESKDAKRYKIIVHKNITTKFGSVYDKTEDYMAIKCLRESFRNKLVAHGSTWSDETCKEIIGTFQPILTDFLLSMRFVKDYPMLKWEKHECYELTGAKKPKKRDYQEKLDKEDPLWIVNNKTKDLFKLVPFFVLPRKHINNLNNNSELFYFFDFPGDLVVMRSPEQHEGITETLVQDLTALIKEKTINVKNYSKTTLTESIFTSNIIKFSKNQIQNLIKEGLFNEDYLLSRNRINSDLFSWLGSKYGLFLISAQAGSGKTTLLADIFKNEIYKNFLVDINNNIYKGKHQPLLLRANRISTASLEREIKYALNIDIDYNFNYLNMDFGYSQSEPFVILIDAGNEHNEPIIFLDSILQFIKKYEGGFIKVVLSWRADLKNELPIVSENYSPYIYAIEDDEQQKHLLAKKAYVLRPFNHNELAEAWVKYTEEKTNLFKPKFSFEDLNYFDKNVVEELKNPLHLRLFLEFFNGKELPESKGFFNFWENWSLQFKDDSGEYEFLLELVGVMFELKTNRLPSKVYYNHPKLKNYINYDINGPFEQLKTKYVLSQFHFDNTRYLTFTIEAFYHYMLGAYLTIKFGQKKPKFILKLLNDSKIAGIENGIQQLLINDLKNKNYKRYIWLLKNIDTKFISVITLPFVHQIKFNYDEKLINSILVNTPQNNVNIFYNSIKLLDSLSQFDLIKKLSIYLFPKVSNNHSFQSFSIQIQALRYFDDDIAIKLLMDLSQKLEYAKFHKLETAYLYLDIGSRIFFVAERNKTVKHEQGINFLIKSLNILLSIYGEKNDKVATAYGHLSYQFYISRDLSKAHDYLTNSIRIREELCANESLHDWRNFNMMGLLLLEKKDFPGATNYFQKAINLLEKFEGPFSHNIAVVYNNLSEIYIQQSKFSIAKDYLDKNFKILSSFYAYNDPILLRQFDQLIKDFSRMQDFNSLIKYLLILWNNTPEKKGGIAYQIFICYKNMKESENAIIWLEKTAQLRQERLGQGDERTKNTIQELIEYAKEINNREILEKWS